MAQPDPKHTPGIAPEPQRTGLARLPEPAELVTKDNVRVAKEIARLSDPDQTCCTPVYAVHGNGIEALVSALLKGTLPGTARPHGAVSAGAIFFCKLSEATPQQRAAAIQEASGYAGDIARRNAIVATCGLGYSEADLRRAGRISMTVTNGFSELNAEDLAFCASRNITLSSIPAAELTARKGCLIFLKPSITDLQIVAGDYAEPGPGTHDVADFALMTRGGLQLNHIASIVPLGHLEKEFLANLGRAAERIPCE